MIDDTARQGSSLIVELIPDLEQGGFTARLPDIPAYGEAAVFIFKSFLILEDGGVPPTA